MSVKIVQKPLPAGVVPYEEISDPTVKQKVMLLNRNIASLAAQLAEVQRAAIELQGRAAFKGTVPGEAEIRRVVSRTLDEKEIADGAEPNVQPDWEQTDATADDYINNKPNIPPAQVNANWEATGGVAAILNKPNSLPNPNAIVLTPIDKDGDAGTPVSYNGSRQEQISVVTKHQDISNKVDYPNGGEDGQVLVKSGPAAEWSDIGLSTAILANRFSATTSSNVSYTTPQQVSVDVTVSGYVPVCVCGITCYGMGTSSSNYDSLKAAFTCSALSVSGNTVTLTISMVQHPTPGGASAQGVKVDFFVLYRKA